MRHPIKSKKNFRQFDIFFSLIQLLLKNGKKIKAKNFLIEVFNLIKIKKKEENVFFIFIKSIYNVSPRIKNLKKKVTQLEVTKQVIEKKPSSLFDFEILIPQKKNVKNIGLLLYKESIKLGLTLLLKNSKKQKYKKFSERLANEIIDAYENKGNSIKEKFLIERNVFRKAEID